MLAKDLITLVIKENQRKISEHAVPEKKEEALSEQFFKSLWNDMFRKARVETDFNKVKIVENSEKPYLKDLDKPIFEGYWVYFFFYSVEYHEFTWHQTREEAEKQFYSMDNAFCGCRLLLHTEQGVIADDEPIQYEEEEEWVETETMKKAFLIIADWAFIKEEKGFRCVNVENEEDYIFFSVDKNQRYMDGTDQYLLNDKDTTLTGEKYWEVKYLAERNREFLFKEWEEK